MVDCAFGFHSIPRSQKIMTSRTRRKLRMRKRTRSEIFRLEAAVREKSVPWWEQIQCCAQGRPHGGSLEDCVCTPLMGPRMQQGWQVLITRFRVEEELCQWATFASDWGLCAASVGISRVLDSLGPCDYSSRDARMLWLFLCIKWIKKKSV